ncbi:MAG: EAL domain-containing protein [Mobilicoccus sp.]|nr:EAL domain-containing protein [Mobilicoccus sp.]
MIAARTCEDDGPRSTNPLAADVTSGARRRRRGGRPQSRPILIGLVVLFSVISAWYLLDPDGGVVYVHGAAIGGCVVAMICGPLLRRDARPRRLYSMPALAGAFLLPTLLQPWIAWQLGPFQASDLMFLAAYSTFICWLMLLARFGASEHTWVSELDAGAAWVGVILALWTFVLGPIATSEELSTEGIWLFYPPLDLILLAFAAVLAIRLGRVPRALRAFVVASVLWLVADTGYALIGRAGVVGVPILEVVDLWAYLAFAVALCHPGLGEMTPPPREERRRRGNRVVVVGIVIAPVVLAIGVPNTGDADRFARTLLVLILLTLVFTRLAFTVRALAAAEKDTREWAIRDPLTGLLNRGALLEAADDRLARDAARGRATLLLFLDCDDFKRVNDTWGHQAGDTLLIDLAGRLRATLDPADDIARHGGDEFVVLASVTDRADGEARIEAVQRAFDAPLQILPDRRHHLTPSIGAAWSGRGDRLTTNTLLERADAAMYTAKQSGKGRAVFFDDTLAEHSRRRAEVGDRLEQVIADDPFHIDLQPVMGGPGYTRVLGWEALARWHDPELGAVPPEVFVSVAEDLGLVGLLGDLILRRACADIAARRELHGPDVWIAVNVSPTQVSEPAYADMVRAALGESGVPSSSLRLELTESVLTVDTVGVRAALEALQTSGVTICIDDFGTGYASLTTLLRWPVDCVKIDRSLVGSIDTDAAARTRLAAVMALVRSLDIAHMVAEGVETDAQARILAGLGCPAVQGWLYGRPAPSTSTRQ